MHATASALLAAHRDHLLSQLTGEQLNHTLSREVNAFLDWASQCPINKVVAVERLQQVALHYVLAQSPSAGLIEQILTIAKAAFRSPLNQTTYVHQLIEHKDFLAIVDKIASHEQLKKDIIHTAVGNPVYAKLLSDIVFHALSDYLVNENPLAKKVPGMSSLMKMGKGLMDSTGGNAAIESALRSYLHKNMQSIVDLSEKVLLRTLDAKQIHHVADQLWHKIKGSPLSVIQQYINDNDIEFATQEGVKLWNHFRQTAYAKSLLQELIGVWFNHFAHKDGVSLLADLQISRDDLVREINAFAEPVVAEMLASGFLAERIEAQLSEFYGSEAVSKLLA
ncbi:hypothetical protein [Agitococcus lubricus]|uniref:Uncharacterized protein n=1 Tax=Agitococcus lubricus TaxID=1077255 RepID=A0A2T5J392_9GAMM|nr:hypothetical protein [Agitococcus lubricus]PTQ91084.1 hypothetical protein C8N29_101156 [Agitococcus lubricus]